ncbi:MAG TPA: cupin domain-containing protein [Candidatus Angelobacter sp.]|jgi:mannose-6-phosphate isomerase-like protein (cupin superfamily)
MHVVNLAQKFSAFQDTFNPKIVGELNNFQVKLVKVQGEFMWHHHDAEDEMFLVLKGELHMKWREPSGAEHDDAINPGEFIIVPHGTEHMPYTLEETHIVLFEPATTLNTGNIRNERTVADLQKI